MKSLDNILKSDSKKELDDAQQAEFIQLQSALDDSSDKNRNFLIAFLLVCVYIFITAFGTTDRDLLLIDTQQALPLLSFKLPMMGFYILAPLVLWTFHFNVLFNLAEHRTKLSAWLQHKANNNTNNYHLLRAYVYNIWAKNSYNRSITASADYHLLNIVVLFLFSIMPLLLLLYVFWRLASFQHGYLSSWHLFCVLSNIAMQLYYWPVIKHSNWKELVEEENQRPLYWRSIIKRENFHLALGLVVATIESMLLILVLYFPIYLKPLLSTSITSWVVPSLDVSGLALNKVQGERTQIINVKVTTEFQKKLRAELTPIKSCDPSFNYPLIDLSLRSLNLINLSHSTMCNVKFAQAELRGAQLDNSTFSGDFTLANMNAVDLRHSRLQRGTQLVKANLTNSNLSYLIANDVDFTLAILLYAKILASELAFSQFVQAKFGFSQFTLANIALANFMRADFEHSRFVNTHMIRVTKLSNDKTIVLKSMQLEEIPPSLFGLKHLEGVDLSLNMLNSDQLSLLVQNLPNLKWLDLSSNALTDIPETIKNLNQLQSLDLSKNQIAKIPKYIAKLEQLKTFNLADNLLTRLPNEIGKLKRLKMLDASNNKIAKLPASLSRLRSLEEIYLQFNVITNASASLGQLAQLVLLDLSYNQLSEIPFVFNGMRRLRILYLSSNEITVLPAEIGRLQNLQELYLSKNQIEVLPKSLQLPSQLITLDLSLNKIRFLPINIFSQIENLDISGNPLQKHPW